MKHEAYNMEQDLFLFCYMFYVACYMLYVLCFMLHVHYSSSQRSMEYSVPAGK
jgi:hypothetical protein